MNKFGLHTFGLPSFGLSDFRLTSFGGDGDGGRKAAFHNSLVDAWYMSGYSNDNPPKEVVGVKGGKMALKNFAFKLNSGFDKYNVNFKSFIYLSSRGDAEVTSSTIIIKSSKVERFPLIYTDNLKSSFKIKVSNVSEEHVLVISGIQMNITQDGIYNISIPSNKHLGFGTSTILDSCNITITQIPEYEGYLCFDGVDDYALWNSSPLLEDYTVICKRKWFNADLTSGKAIASKRKTGDKLDGAFVFERIYPLERAINYGLSTYIEISQQDVVYQTASSYNGHYALNRGTETDTELLSLGSAGPNSEFAQCAIAYFALYSRTLTTQEIEKEKVKLEAEWNKRLIK